MDIFLAAVVNTPDPRTGDARHDLCERPVVGFAGLFCGAASCVEMASFGAAKERVFRDFQKIKHATPSYDSSLTVLWVIDPQALDSAFRRVLAQFVALFGECNVTTFDGKSLCGIRDRGQVPWTLMMVSADAARLCPTLTTAAADKGRELAAALQVPGLIALKGNCTAMKQAPKFVDNFLKES